MNWQPIIVTPPAWEMLLIFNEGDRMPRLGYFNEATGWNDRENGYVTAPDFWCKLTTPAGKDFVF